MKKLDKKGFTIIEVVLVLAIAGLIFLIVFMALPQLQRSRRDTQRKNDAGRVMAQLESYAGNNNGSYPPEAQLNTAGGFVDRYITNAGAVFEDPQTGTYTFVTNVAPNLGQMQYELGQRCNGENLQNGNARDVAIRVRLETANTYYCQDNL